jgi:hypothetical protein
MGDFYGDAKYGIIERFEFAAHQAVKTMTGDSTLVKRFYPKGPIKILKFGVRHIATQGGTEVTVNLKRVSSTLATVVASTDSTPWSIASVALNKDCDAGSYLTIDTAGTVATGTVHCFMDFRRIYNAKHDAAN